MPAKSFHGIIGQSAAMQRLFELIGKLAEDDYATVLIQGESGTGKELVAKAIHADSTRSTRNFVPLNCAAIPDDLLESELFGYTKGAFTGATAPKTGRIEYANGGTLFLDEIGDMKPVLQAKLLRVLQEREFEPVGGLKPVAVDVRVIAATHRDLEQMVSEGIFREDLYYRLNVVPLVIPPLRERLEDLPLLVDHFIKVISKDRKKPLLGFDARTIRALSRIPWKGNVRELENLIRHMTILCGGAVATYEDLPEKYRQDAALPQVKAPDQPSHIVMAREGREPEESSAPEAPEGVALMEEGDWPEEGIDFNTLVNDFEIRLITQALRVTQGNKKEAARILNLKRTTLLEKIKKKELASGWTGEE